MKNDPPQPVHAVVHVGAGRRLNRPDRPRLALVVSGVSRRRSTLDPETRARWLAWLDRPVLPKSGTQMKLPGLDARAEQELTRREVPSAQGAAK